MAEIGGICCIDESGHPDESGAQYVIKCVCEGGGGLNLLIQNQTSTTQP